MDESNDATCFWKRAADLGYSPDLGDVVSAAIADIFQTYDQQVAKAEEAALAATVGNASDSMSLIEQGSSDDEDDDDDMSSVDTYAGSPINRTKMVVFDDSDSDGTMSVSHGSLHCPPVRSKDTDGVIEWEPVRWQPVDSQDAWSNRRPSRSQSGESPCMRCKAYDTHCKSAAENYKRTLDNYTKTVAQLMAGFKTVIERYPELKVDCSDERLYYMVQAALGRNNLVRQMVQMAATSALRARNLQPESGKGELVAVHEALSTCYSDGDAARLILDRYADLHVQYTQCWRDMCAKISRDITVMEFVTLTGNRPGATHGEPWCEARAYIQRVKFRLRGLAPRTLADSCSDKLNDLDDILTRVPRDPTVSKGAASLLVETLRHKLDLESERCASDSHMTDLILDIRSDLTILDTLVGIGALSAKTLLHERHLLVCQLRKLHRTQGLQHVDKVQ